MALDKDVLGALMSSKVSAIPGITITSSAELDAYHKAIADAVISHIKAAAVVTTAGADPQGGSVSSTGTIS